MENQKNDNLNMLEAIVQNTEMGKNTLDQLVPMAEDEQFKAELLADLVRQVWPLFAEGRLKPQLQQSFASSQAEAAYATLASNSVNGKLVLRLDESLG